jgi:hypothetical protein
MRKIFQGRRRRRALAIAIIGALAFPAVFTAVSSADAGSAQAAVSSGTISGTVRKSSTTGAGFGGLTVYLGAQAASTVPRPGPPLPQEDPSRYRSTVTASDGSYAFDEVPFTTGGYTVSVAPPSDGSFAAPEPVSPVIPQVSAPDPVVDLVLDQPGATLTGQVASAQGGAVVAGALVVATGAVRLSATTDAAGRYTIRGLRAGSYDVVASAPHFRSSTTITSTLPVGQTVSTGAIRIDRLSVVSGTVRASGPAATPLPGIVVTLHESTAVTDAQGRFSLADIPSGTRTLNITDPSGTFTNATLSVAVPVGTDVSGIDVRLTRPSSLVGKVTGNDAARTPIPNVVISLRDTRKTTTTDSQGEYVIEGVLADLYFLDIDVPESSPFSAENRVIEVTGDSPSQRIDVVADRKSAVVGTVSLPAPLGGTAATIEVTMRTKHQTDDGCCVYQDAYTQTVKADSSGKAAFRFASVSPIMENFRWDGGPEAAVYVVSARVVSGGTGEYMTTWWGDATTIESATSFEVPVNAPDLRRDITIQRPKAFESAPTPTINGTAVVGSTLTAKTGAWVPKGTLKFAWAADGVPISGATGFQFGVTDAVLGKKLTVTVVGTGAGYATTTRTSAATAAVVRKVAAGQVTVSGSALVGSKLTVSPGTWSPAPVTLSIQWKRNGTAIAGATSSTYTLTAADRGARLSATVTGARTGYTSTSVTSSSTATVQDVFRSNVWPKLTGTAAVGRELTLSVGSWSPTPTSYEIQWLRDGAPIAGATSTRYTIVDADYGHRLSANVTPVKTDYVKKARATNLTATVVRLLTATPTPQVIGTRVVGTTLVASTTAWGPSPVALRFQWVRNGRIVPGETGTAYTLTTADLGARISVSVTGVKTGYVSVTKVSTPTGAIAAPPAK